MKKVFVFCMVVLVVLLTGILWVRRNNQIVLAPASGIKIVTSFYPLAEFTKQVGGEKVRVISIVPPGVEPHDFEVTPRDIANVYTSKLFIFNGSGLDPWAEKIVLDIQKKSIEVVGMAEHFTPRNSVEGDEQENTDPHFWLDPLLVQKEIEIIRDTLKKIDPENGVFYETNAARYLARLSELDTKYRNGLAHCALRDIVASHAAFGYLAKRYTLHVTTIAGLSPEEEPSPKRIAEIAHIAREKGIRYIFFETLVAPKLAETIAQEIGAQTLVFNPIEGLTPEELAVGKEYISLMEENLENLRKALVCT